MARENDENHVRIWIFLLIVFSHILTNKYVNGKKSSISMTRNYTIEGENGDVIDCVDIYKQPAFSNPLLKDHTLQKRPSSYPSGITGENKEEIFEGWKKNGECPKGTIPILRTNVFTYRKSTPIFPNRTRHNAIDILVHEYAQVSVDAGPYYGAQAELNVWKPAIFNGELSLSQMWVAAGHRQSLNTIEVGWHVYPGFYGGCLFIGRDNYQTTGCYNLKCPGFVQTSRTILIGGELTPVSSYNGPQRFIQVIIHKDKQSGNWWLRVQGREVGYWPGSIFTNLRESSEWITWGGEITNFKKGGRHTSTQMGSGHFPSEGFHKAAYTSNLRIIDQFGGIRDPQFLEPYVSNPSCYDLKYGRKDHRYGPHFYFGGPGFSAHCP